MTEKFLKAKHWQLFTLMFGIPMFLQILTLILITLNINSNGNPNLTTFLSFTSIFPIIIFLYAGLTFGWLWSIGIGLQKYVPTEMKMKVRKFKIFFFSPFIYILLILGIILTAYLGFTTGDNALGGLVGKMLLFVLPVHLFSMFCMFYLLYFVSKTIKTVELKRIVTFSDFEGEFFMIWFFPIGIWFIQPRINKIIAE